MLIRIGDIDTGNGTGGYMMLLLVARVVRIGSLSDANTRKKNDRTQNFSVIYSVSSIEFSMLK
jgi:hypothetical protein